MKPEDIERIKDLLPTSLGNAEIREQYAREILQRSIVSSRMEIVRYLAKIREVATELSAGRINAAKAREGLLNVLSQIGYDTTDDDGKISNPVSQRRLDLILETQRQMAASVARLSLETEDTLDMYPAWELTRADAPAKPREDWPARWNAAGESVNWEGARKGIYYGSGVGIGFVALKSSPIWAALGSGVGGYRDTLGNPYPPFAFGSYMDWVDVDRETAEQLGLIKSGEAVPTPLEQNQPTLSPDDAELLEAAKRVGWPGLFDDLK